MDVQSRGGAGRGGPDPPATPASNKTTREIRANPDILGGMGWEPEQAVGR